VEIDALLAAVTTEAERRGRRPPSPAKEKPVADAKPQRRQEAVEELLRRIPGSLEYGADCAPMIWFFAPSADARLAGASHSNSCSRLRRPLCASRAMTDNRRDGWLPFKEARAFVRRLSLKSREEWSDY
jgi:hypothetical protein